MQFSRRTVLSTVLAGGLSSALLSRADEAAPRAICFGLLPFGTASWEMDVIRRNAFDKSRNVAIEPIQFASTKDTQTALSRGKADVVLLDWLWVVGQRADGADWTFAPISSAAGSLIARAGSTYRSVADLAGARLGIVSPLDKNWLIFQSYAKRQFDTDLDRVVTKIIASPPELLARLTAGKIDAMITYWPFAAKAEARGMRHMVSLDEAVRALGVTGPVPFSGYVFSRSWAENNRPLIDGFLKAADQARTVLATSDDAWVPLRPMLGVDNDAEFETLKAAYRRGIVHGTDPRSLEDAAKLYRALAEIGGLGMVGASSEIPKGTFW
jgi:NitT/TauT family transport system substrate-binding protein